MDDPSEPLGTSVIFLGAGSVRFGRSVISDDIQAENQHNPLRFESPPPS